MRLASEAYDRSQLKAAWWAVNFAFILNGFMWSTLVVRLPEFRDRLSVSNGQLGTLLVFGALGILMALRFAAKWCLKFGTRRVVAFVGAGIAVPLIGISHASNNFAFASLLFILGFFAATHDVAMNNQGAHLEHLTKSSLMNSFHGMFSVGALLGGGYGALCAKFDVSIQTQVIPIALLAIGLAPIMLKLLLPEEEKFEPQSEKPKVRNAIRAFLVLGLIGLAAAITEGAASDWGAITMRDNFEVSSAFAALPYLFFEIFMVIGRFSGDQLTERLNRITVLKFGGLISGLGLLVGLLINQPWSIIFGWAILGAGISVAIPSMFSAAAESARTTKSGDITPAHAVAAVGGISYVGFLVGPPVIGWLATGFGLTKALYLLVACCFLMFILASISNPK